MKRVHAIEADALRHGKPGEVRADDAALSLRFWGVRGSIPISRPDSMGFGGNTPCIEVRVGERLFIIDAGSGIVPLGLELRDKGVRKIDILLSHLHHDHVMGLFFFKPFYNPDAEITIYCGNLDGETAEAPLRRLFSPPLFPITFDDLPAKVRFVGFKAGETLTFPDGLKVQTHPLVHPAGSTAYRFEADGRVAAVVTDVEHRNTGGPCEQLCGFLRDADLIVYDAMLCPSEYPSCRGWGHSTQSEGVALCERAHVGQMAAFHHHPAYTDEKLEELERMVAAMKPGSFLAREGQVVVLPRRRAVMAREIASADAK